MWVLGINAPPAGFHDSAACLVNERGDLMAFAEEERLTRKKHALQQGPMHAARYCLKQVGIAPVDVDVVAIGWNVPYIYNIYGRQWTLEAATAWLKEVLGWDVSLPTIPDIEFVRHHVAHATVALHASGFESAALVVVDGNGDDESVSIFRGFQAEGRLIRKLVWPPSHSLGWMYDAASRYIGFDFLEAGKTMGLAAYGRARRVTPWPLLDSEGHLLQPPFPIPSGYAYEDILGNWRSQFEKHGAGRVTRDRHNLHRDDIAVRVAWSAQYALEQGLEELVRIARDATGELNVCLAGGVALNCSANGLLVEPVYVPPVPHDAGVALGAAWHVAPPRRADGPLTPFLGPEAMTTPPVPDDVQGLVSAPFDAAQVAQALLGGRVGAIVHGRSEAGPRALGHRSIVALPTPEGVRDRVTLIKRREPWRPFGPVALASQSAHLWHQREHLARYMLGSVTVTDAARTHMPAAIHIDGTTRPQSLPDDSSEPVAELLRHLGDAGGVLINTSFNRRGEPIVGSAREAVLTYRAMELDFLALEDRVYATATDWWRPA